MPFQFFFCRNMRLLDCCFLMSSKNALRRVIKTLTCFCNMKLSGSEANSCNVTVILTTITLVNRNVSIGHRYKNPIF